MVKRTRLFVCIAFFLVAMQFGLISTQMVHAQSGASNIDKVSALTNRDNRTVTSDLSAAREKNATIVSDPLVRVLISKGVLTADV